MDHLDRQIMGLLTQDARASMADLGRRVGLSRTATLARVRRLEREGVIRGYHADVRAGVPDDAHTARVAVAVRTADMAAYIRRLCAAFPELQEAESVAGEFDVLLRFSAASAARLDEILDGINGWRETVRTTTYVVLTTYVSR